jgi:segregation and condensation protein A
LPRIERDIFTTTVYANVENVTRPLPKLELQGLFIAFKELMNRINMQEHYEIVREGLSIRERMTNVLSSLRQLKFVTFESMFTFAEGRSGAVVTFMAILELLRQNLVDIVQTEAYGSIYLNLKIEYAEG